MPVARPKLFLFVVLLVAVAGVAPGLRAAAYDAAFVSQVAPSFVESGTTASVMVTMRNTGTATWYRDQGDVFLSAQLPQDNFYWCIQGNPYGSVGGNRVLLPGDVPPGAEATFAFDVKPLDCGFSITAPLRFRMLSQTYGTFGDMTPDSGRSGVERSEVRVATGAGHRSGRRHDFRQRHLPQYDQFHLERRRRLYVAAGGAGG